MARTRLPAWHWAFSAFRVGDGLSHALIPLAVVEFHGGASWLVAATVAAMNLASVPATFLWAKAMDRGRGRRRLAVMGFLVSVAALAVMSLVPVYPVFLAAAVAYTLFGTATAPAASVLVLESFPRGQWGPASGRLSRATGVAYLGGAMLALAAALAGRLHFPTVFLAAAAVSVLAAVVAWYSIAPFQGGGPVQRIPAAAAAAGQRRIERLWFFPARLRHRPTRRGVREAFTDAPAPFLVGVMLAFAGTLVVLASYPWVLRERMGLSLGLVLLAQMPAALASLTLFPVAGAVAARWREPLGVTVGAAARLVALPGIAAAVFWFDALGPAVGLALLLAMHALMGASFAFLQVNGSLQAALFHPRGRGQGIGAFHAATATGTLLGAVLGAVGLLLLPLGGVYLLGAAMTVVGCLAMAVAVRGSPAVENRD